MAEWRKYRLGDICSIQNGFSFRSSEFVGYEEDTLEVVKMGHIEPGGGLRKDPKRDYVRREAKLKKWILNRGDIIMAMTDMKDNVVILGIPALIDRDDHYVLNQRVARISLADKDSIDLQFLYNYLKWGEFVQTLQSKANSGVQVNLPTDSIKDSIITAPSISEQRTIASILSSLDDKIDLLHRQNKTLEALAETFFRQWFVEEAAGREVGTLGDVSACIKESIIPEHMIQGALYVGLEHIERKNIVLTRNGTADRLASNKYVFAEDDILFGKLRPYFHKVCFAPFHGVCSTDILVIRPKEQSLYPFCLFTLFQKDVVDFSDITSEGTRMPRTSWDILKDYPILIPHEEVLTRFNTIAEPAIHKLKENRTQILTLTLLRDTLLPKLMSGEVSVRDIQMRG